MFLLSMELIELPKTQWAQPYLCIQKVQNDDASKATNIYLATRAELFVLFGQQGAKIQTGRLSCKFISTQNIITFIQWIESKFENVENCVPSSIQFGCDNEFSLFLQSKYGLKPSRQKEYHVFNNIPNDLLFPFREKWITMKIEGDAGSNKIPSPTIIKTQTSNAQFSLF